MVRYLLPFLILVPPTGVADEQQKPRSIETLIRRVLKAEIRTEEVKALAEFGFVAISTIRQKSKENPKTAEAVLRKLASVWCGWLGSEDAKKRQHAEAYLYELGNDAVEALRKVTREGTPHARLSAERLLVMIKFCISYELYRRIGNVFARYERSGVRERISAVLRLEQLGGSKSIETLKRIVLTEKEEMVRVVAANALVRVADLSVLKFIKEQGLSEKITAPPDRYLLLLSQGIKLRQMEDYRGALEEFQKILKENPSDYRANYEAAMCYLFLEEYHSSIKHFKICLKERDDDYLLHYNLACAYALAGHREKAFEHLRKAVECGYDDAEHMENDEDLRSLRDDERFKDLLERIRENGGEKK